MEWPVYYCSLFIGILTFFLWGFIGSSQVMHQVRYQPVITPSDYGLPWERLQLLTSDQVPIAGWLIPHTNSKGILLLLHGFGTCKADLLDLAKFLHDAGEYNLVLIDFRGHGASGGDYISFGEYEIQDVRAALDFLSEEPILKQLPIGCLGISMGGSIGLLAAAQLPQIRAVVSDSAYVDLGKAIARAVRMSYHIPRFPFGQIVVWATELRLRCNVRNLGPAHAIEKISPRPVMLIHGTKDKTTPYQDAEILFQLAKNPKKLWLVQGAEHVGAFFKDKDAYLQQVLEFFKDGLHRTA